MKKPLTEAEQEEWDWLQDYVTDSPVSEVVEYSGVSTRTIMRINDNGQYVPSKKTRAKLLQWAKDDIDSRRDDCPW